MDDQRRPGRHDGHRDRGVPEGSELLDAFCVAIGLEDDTVVGEVDGDSVTFQIERPPERASEFESRLRHHTCQ